jgi:hypothetical protein
MSDLSRYYPLGGHEPWPSSDEPFLMLIRTAYTAICERLDFADPDELAGFISGMDLLREAVL